VTYLLWSYTKTIHFFKCLWLIDIKYVGRISYDLFVLRVYDLKSTDSTFLASSQLITSIHWPCHCSAHVYVAIHFCDSVRSFWVEANLCRFLLFLLLPNTDRIHKLIIIVCLFLYCPRRSNYQRERAVVLLFLYLPALSHDLDFQCHMSSRICVFMFY